MSGYQMRLAQKVGFSEPKTVEANDSTVVDVRGCTGLTAFFDSGNGATCDATPCYEDGTPIPNAQAEALTSGQRLDAAAHFYLVEPSGGDAVVLVVG